MVGGTRDEDGQVVDMEAINEFGADLAPSVSKCKKTNKDRTRIPIMQSAIEDVRAESMKFEASEAKKNLENLRNACGCSHLFS